MGGGAVVSVAQLVRTPDIGHVCTLEATVLLQSS